MSGYVELNLPIPFSSFFRDFTYLSGNRNVLHIKRLVI